MRRLLMTLPVVGLLVFGLGLTAGAGNYCQQGRHHECETTTTTSTTTTTTTPTTTSSSTTVPEETTTSAPVDTTTTLVTTTSAPTTIPGSFTAEGLCADGVPTIRVGLEGVTVDVYAVLFDEELWGRTITDSGDYDATPGGPYVLIDSNGVRVEVDVPTDCAVTTTAAPTTTVDDSSVSTLPFTGPFENVSVLGASAVGLIILGWMILKEARRED